MVPTVGCWAPDMAPLEEPDEATDIAGVELELAAGTGLLEDDEAAGSSASKEYGGGGGSSLSSFCEASHALYASSPSALSSRPDPDPPASAEEASYFGREAQ